MECDTCHASFMCGAENHRSNLLIACDAMLSTANPTALKLLDACEHVFCEVAALEDVTVRRSPRLAADLAAH